MSPAFFRSFAIIPAAGASRRMGQDKLLLPWRGRTIVEHVLDAWQSSRVDRVVLIIRPADDRLALLGDRHGVDVVVPPAAPAEMKDSVCLGLEHVKRNYDPHPTDAWLLAPADMPRLSTPVIDRLLAAYRPHRPQVQVAVASGRRGHPILLPWSWAADVAGLPDGSGINSLLAAGNLAEVETEDVGIHADLDTPEDYRRLR
jgi:molybdenum cofactor cytidylyltransferase